MTKQTCNEYIELLISMLEISKGNKNLQASYLQSFVQIYGPIPDKYGDKIRELMR